MSTSRIVGGVRAWRSSGTALAVVLSAGACASDVARERPEDAPSGIVAQAACPAGTGDCDLDPSNGCETSTLGDPDHCGACYARCTNPAGATTCVAGACSFACSSRWRDCDGQKPNGCETDVNADPAHCGQCGAGCQTWQTCTGGSCIFDQCPLGREDCDGDPTNGCERRVCGGCSGSPCAANETCDGTTCRCSVGQADCNGGSDGCEVRVETDPNNCGSCGNVCSSGVCVDGVCCATGCTGPCVACSAVKKGHGVDGTCEPVASGADPDGDCHAAAEQACGADGECDGAGACRLRPADAVCAPAQCVLATLLEPQTCDGTGACLPTGGVACPGSYRCADATSCRTTCTNASHCVPGHFCDGGACLPAKPNGAPCTNPGECASALCVDEVCCDTPCAGSCEACTAALKGSGADGACDAIDAGKGARPAGACPDAGPASCGTNGTCDGARACARYAASTACGGTVCADDPGGTSSIAGALCDGAGACRTSASTTCGLYRCDGAKCATQCVSGAQCVAAAFCDDGECRLRRTAGEPCEGAADCASGFCRDGVCCKSECAGVCEACDGAGTEGTCAAVTGTPRPEHGTCADDGAGCAGTCDGTTRSVCSYPSGDVSCGAPACTGGSARTSACDGSGRCVARPPVACSPYTCDDATCRSSCARDADCVEGFRCESTTGACLPTTGRCLDEDTFEANDRTVVECAPYKCGSGACRQSCSASSDCVLGTVCDTRQGQGTCVPAEAGTGGRSEGGCGCRVAPRPPITMGAAWLLGALVLEGRRRRRRRGGCAPRNR